MGAKCFKDSDTPWITFKCNFVNIKNSNNLEMDFTDSGIPEEKEENNCCCLSWLHRGGKREKETTELPSWIRKLST